MRFINLIFVCLLFCCSGKIENASNTSEPLMAVKKIHLFRINGMVDMSKPITTHYFSITTDKIFRISELRKSDGSLLQSDTLNTLMKNNKSLLTEAESLLKEVENNELDNDGNRWGFTIFYKNKQQRNFSYKNDVPVHPIVAKMYRLLITLEK